jgi:hypothetical protein
MTRDESHPTAPLIVHKRFEDVRPPTAAAK